MTKADYIRKTEPTAAEIDWPAALQELQEKFNALQAKFLTLLAKLDADGGVTDTNYAATQGTGVVAVTKLLSASV